MPARTLIPLLALLPSPACAVEMATADPEDIAREVRNANAPGGSPDLLERWGEARRRIDEHAGFSWTAGYYSASLAAIGGDGVPFGASGELSIQGLWKPGQRWTDNPTELRFRLRHRHALGGTAASELSDDVGAIWGVIDGFSDSGFEVPDFFLRHEFERAGLEIRYGQMSIDSQFGGHQLASAKHYFLNQAFASNPAVAFPRFGAGLTAVKRFDNGLSIGLGATTVQGTQQGDQVDFKFSSGDLFHALQFAYDFKGADELPQRLQLLGWHSDSVEDAGQPEGQGVQLTYERSLDADGTRFFSTLAWADGGAAPLDYFLSAGLGRPCGGDDFAGLAVGAGRGSGDGRPFQLVVEGFYRRQWGEHFEVAPDVQLLIGEDLATSPGVRLIAGVRVAASF